MNLPEARVPYSEELKAHLIPLLSDAVNWEILVEKLRHVFKIDSDFNEQIFGKQMAIVRGQLHNILTSLREGDSPIQLVHRPLLLIEEDELPGTEKLPQESLTSVPSSESHRKHRHRRVTANPLCSCW